MRNMVVPLIDQLGNCTYQPVSTSQQENIPNNPKTKSQIKIQYIETNIKIVEEPYLNVLDGFIHEI
jgi:hypothetical protein